ncbi:MAG: hypothetical protein CMH52_09730 [Myxococcales bacterium]|nr:hypothetical protein [Myxococcales bacterium]
MRAKLFFSGCALVVSCTLCLFSTVNAKTPVSPVKRVKSAPIKMKKGLKKSSLVRKYRVKRVSKRQKWPTRRPKKLKGILPKIGPAPYESGERLVFKIQMFGSHAGNVILAVGDQTEVNGRMQTPFVGFMRSSEFLNKFYPVENRLVVLADSQSLLPVKTDFFVRENGKAIDYHTKFDHKTRLLHSLKLKNGKRQKRNFTPATDIHEPLGSVYAVRRMDLKPGDQFQRYIWDGRKERLIDCKVVGFETVTTDAGVFETLKIEITTRVSGGFIKRGVLNNPIRKGTIWIANDRWRTPVKMIAPTKLGNAEAVLIRRYVEKGPVDGASGPATLGLSQ